MKGEIYNVIGENASLNRITTAIGKEVHDVHIVITPTPNLNQVSYELDGSKIERIGFRPRHSLDEGVREIVERFRAFLRIRTRKEVRAIADSMPTLSEA
jgi:nucleoside-diphosphate-sugar epimerase